ncbi:hypothetical protein K432DRAFT_202439 [Lepidopterella palustris CBS 459.81]|uniref:Uncharacterized protein n=1 Tax=Lepidopterella palustris CBS 459.81 TaxID=1314670 RepID=A0A8E2JKE2_9PEZI|nr:hypothetical protein K432DRAFT_202439 [Lepidopterella palustris CBS 459.81]
MATTHDSALTVLFSAHTLSLLCSPRSRTMNLAFRLTAPSTRTAERKNIYTLPLSIHAIPGPFSRNNKEKSGRPRR